MRTREAVMTWQRRALNDSGEEKEVVAEETSESRGGRRRAEAEFVKEK